MSKAEHFLLSFKYGKKNYIKPIADQLPIPVAIYFRWNYFFVLLAIFEFMEARAYLEQDFIKNYTCFVLSNICLRSLLAPRNFSRKWTCLLFNHQEAKKMIFLSQWPFRYIRYAALRNNIAKLTKKSRGCFYSFMDLYKPEY